MDEKTLKQVTDAIGKSVPEIVTGVVDIKIKEAMAKSASELEEIKKELKKYSLASKKSQPEVKEAFVKTAMVSIIKETWNESVTNETSFKKIVDSTMKTMNEGTATEGAELVFDQFEKDILRVINTYNIAGDVKILPLIKGDKVSLPKGTNGITTYFTAEGVAHTESDATTAFIEINIAKMTTLTDMTQELLNDTMTIPDLYNLIVEFIGESQAEFLETQILTGTGSIKGVLVNTSINTISLAATETSADISDDDLVDVLVKCATKFKRNKESVKWRFSQYVFGKIYKLKTLDGYKLYPEMKDGMLMGYKYELSDVGFVQDVTEDIAEAPLLMFGDLKYFTLAKRKGLSMERGFYGDNWKKDIESLKSNARAGGTLTFPEAITILKNGASS